MAWDKDLPDGAASIAVGDDSIRANNAALETALTAEHEFSTGGANTGRHKFQIGAASAMAVLAGSVNGTITFVDDQRTNPCLAIIDGGLLKYVDIHQPDTLPRLDERSPFTVCQFAEIQTITPVSGTPDTLAVDLEGSPMKKATIVGDTILSNPIGDGGTVGSYGTTVQFEIIQDGTGGHTLTFGSEYVAVGGVAPAFGSGANESTVFTISTLSGTKYLISSSPAVSTL